MDVLQAAVSIRRRLDAQILLIFLAPSRWQVANGQLLIEQRLFELKTDDDVQVVSRLVGLDADQRWRDVIDGPKKVVQLHVADSRGKCGLKLRKEVLPERPAASDEVFPHSRL